MKIDQLTFKSEKFKVNVSHFRQEEPKGIVIIFPGAGYSHMGPCLYYPSGALYNAGYEILNLEYDFRRERLKDNLVETYREFFQFLYSNLIELDLPEEKIILSKSIGTRIIGSGDLTNFDKVIWLTPALKDDFVFHSMLENSHKSLCVIGDADPFYERSRVEQFSKEKLETLVINGADHGLDIDSDLNKSLDELKNIISTIEKFVLK
ncbi:hypothetical protein HBN50_03280 [Halobacteriovorax sp. GB3]|uniref:hypothetical protein n=1 Tax=Halobacteriovorax sp. GB3 TaxID=2719615 RepID=UPI0023625762|nr:hypothetical protein [Halobacteriovorax sp. GB3]MDD0852099.1 hypothetical protein [Halobacteriovorax sp. GB3]